MNSQMMSVALSLTRFASVERQVPSMIQPVSAVSSSFARTFAWNSSAGQAFQFGPQ